MPRHFKPSRVLGSHTRQPSTQAPSNVYNKDEAWPDGNNEYLATCSGQVPSRYSSTNASPVYRNAPVFKADGLQSVAWKEGGHPHHHVVYGNYPDLGGTVASTSTILRGSDIEVAAEDEQVEYGCHLGSGNPWSQTGEQVSSNPGVGTTNHVNPDWPLSSNMALLGLHNHVDSHLGQYHTKVNLLETEPNQRLHLDSVHHYHDDNSNDHSQESACQDQEPLPPEVPAISDFPTELPVYGGSMQRSQAPWSVVNTRKYQQYQTMPADTALHSYDADTYEYHSELNDVERGTSLSLQYPMSAGRYDASETRSSHSEMLFHGDTPHDVQASRDSTSIMATTEAASDGNLPLPGGSFQFGRYSDATSQHDFGKREFESNSYSRFQPPPSRTRESTTMSPSGLTWLQPQDIVQCEQCDATFSGEYRLGNLARHWRLKHAGQVPVVYPCESVGCDSEFLRKDARLKHYRSKHQHLAPRELIRRASSRSRYSDAPER